MEFAALAFLGGGVLGYRLWRGALALLLAEAEAIDAGVEPPPPHRLERLPLIGPILGMVWFARLGELLLPERTVGGAGPFVGVACGLGAAAFALKLGPTWAFLGVAPLTVVLIVASACDLICGLILDELSGLAFLYMVAYVCVTHAAHFAGVLPPPLAPPYAYDAAALSLATGLYGLLAVGLVAVLADARTWFGADTPALGGGVIKLAMGLAVLAGWQGVASALFLAALLVVVPAGIALSRHRPAEGEPDALLFPFVPFFTLGAVVTLWFGHPAVLELYLALNNAVVGAIISHG